MGNELWQIIVAVFGALGGIETVKWLYSRKANRRLADAEATAKETSVMQDSYMFIQQLLSDKEKRFEEQTLRLRKAQDELFKECHLRHVAELELAKYKCEDMQCPFRKPPNAYTPPMPGVTRDEYHNNKKD